MAKLKVFTAQMGFFETVVAVPSKKAALQVWGAHQDLFSTGMAAKSTDEAACKAALAEPGVVLRRAVGSNDAFTAGGALGAVKLPKIKPPTPDKTAKANKPPKARKPPSRKVLTAAEEAVTQRRERYAREREAIAVRRRALEEEEQALRTTFEAERTKLERTRAKAAEAYRKAGG